jgi:rhodanese-related sulfurtransferase
VKLLDVREPHEYKISRIPGAELIPLGELPDSLQDLEADEEYVVHCKSGARSLQAVELMREAGLKAKSMRGGINAYARTIDDSIPTY